MPPKVSEDYKERKKEILLECALKCFGEKGYQSTTMDDIVAYSKTSKGLIYNYFKSKEELYITLMQERTKHSFEIFNERFKNLHSATQKLRELFRIYRETPLSDDWKNLIRVHMEFWINSARYENLTDIMQHRYKVQYRDFLSSIIAEGKNSGEFKEDIDPDLIASLFWAIIDGICLHYSVVGEDYAYSDHFVQVEEMLLNNILA